MKLILVLLFTFSGLRASCQNSSVVKPTGKSFPTNISKDNFGKLSNFENKIVAFDGTIERAENSKNNTPCYKLKIGGESYLWTTLMINDTINKVGDEIRVLGYLTSTNIIEPGDREKKYVDGKYMVIAFGLVDFKNANLLFVDKQMAGRQQAEWIDGKIPASK